MKVLHVMASGATGGGAIHLLGLLPELLKLGVDCTAMVGTDGPTAMQLRRSGIETVGIHLMRSRFDGTAPLAIWRHIAKVKPDIVHLHGTRAAFFTTMLPRHKVRAKLLYTAHGLSYRGARVVTRPFFVAVERRIGRCVDEVISVSNHDLQDLRQRCSVMGGHHIPNAVDAQRFMGGDRLMARRTLGLLQGTRVVGTVSRLVAQKSVVNLVRAMAYCKDATLVIVGDGPQRGDIEKLIACLGIQSRVRLLGCRTDVEKILPAFDLFALSSKWEGEPIALLEAMAAGVPCVATWTPGTSEILGPNKAGHLIHNATPELLGQAITNLLDHEQERRRLIKVGRNVVLGRTYGVNAQRVLKVYERIKPPAP